MNFVTITPASGEHNVFTYDEVANFLVKHLEQYGDKKEDILKCIQYAMDPEKGGFIQLGIINNEIAGAVIINKTGMDGYIPSNILVYIAVDGAHRGQGLGKKLMREVMSTTSGGIALHVEPDNPAKFLYEKLGFTNKYLEMRYIHNS